MFRVKLQRVLLKSKRFNLRRLPEVEIMYILILTIVGFGLGQGGFSAAPMVTTQEFSNESSCDQAGKLWVAQSRQMLYPTRKKAGVVSYLCVKK
jgi:hypothetical protein